MVKLNTYHFGELEITEEDVIHFSGGLIGFPDGRRFVIVKNPDPGVPFDWLQSLDDPKLAYVIVDPFWFKKDYEFELAPEHLLELGIRKQEDTAVFCIVVVPENIAKISANLLAPVVVNLNTKQAKQVVLLDKRYTTRHYILEELRKSPEEGA